MPHEPPARWDTERVDTLVGGLLQAGVIIAASVGLIGGGLALLHRHADPTRFGDFAGSREPLRSLGAVMRATLAGEPRAITQLGILLLIATPIARVVLSLGVFLHQRDRTYILVTLTVLLLLLWGLLAFPG
jgi:uncharacterized membrane protein